MKNRREFIKTSLAMATGVVATKITPAFADLKKESCYKGIVYTKDSPGRWAKKVGSHSPIVTVDKGKVTIETKHPMTAKHYIVRHTLVSGDGEVLGEKTFYPSDKRALSVFKVEGKHPVLYATSFCNLHDLWVKKFNM